jgi:hypothetical protein
MAIPECPTCAGEGFTSVRGRLPLSYYIARGWIRRVRDENGETLVPTRKLFRAEITEGGFDALFQKCWCNQQIIHLSRRLGEPLYWKNDHSGYSQKVVMKCWAPAMPRAGPELLEPLNEGEVHFLRGYVAQWVLGVSRLGQKPYPDYRPLPISKWLPQVANATSKDDFMALDEMLAEYGLDPF